MEVFIFAIIFVVGFLVYKKSKTNKYPIRIYEIKKALETKAEILRHKSKDAYEADKLVQLSKDLGMINCSASALKENWPRARPNLMHLTSEEMLRMLNLDSSDRVEDYKAAIFDLMAKIDKKSMY